MYYLFVDDATAGPFSEEEMVTKWERGAIPAEALCCRAGEVAWAPFREVFEVTEEGRAQPRGAGFTALPPPTPQVMTPPREARLRPRRTRHSASRWVG